MSEERKSFYKNNQFTEDRISGFYFFGQSVGDKTDFTVAVKAGDNDFQEFVNLHIKQKDGEISINGLDAQNLDVLISNLAYMRNRLAQDYPDWGKWQCVYPKPSDND